MPTGAKKIEFSGMVAVKVFVPPSTTFSVVGD
jgi:hypothetical protein